jgi:hypothetical protein
MYPRATRNLVLSLSLGPPSPDFCFQPLGYAHVRITSIAVGVNHVVNS